MKIVYDTDTGKILEFFTVGIFADEEGTSMIEWDGEAPQPRDHFKVDNGQVVRKSAGERKTMEDQQQERYIRGKRDNLLNSTVDTLNGPRWSSLVPEKQAEWIQYRKALLNVPQQADQYNVIWPKVPK